MVPSRSPTTRHFGNRARFDRLVEWHRAREVQDKEYGMQEEAKADRDRSSEAVPNGGNGGDQSEREAEQRAARQTEEDANPLAPPVNTQAGS